MNALSGVSLESEGKCRQVNTFQYGRLQLHTITMKTLGNLIFELEAKGDRTRFDEYVENKIPFLASNSDLIAGTYEGGLKVWEATGDLVLYLEQESLYQADKRYLDVGCGAGLLGIGALKFEPQMVHFMDFNEQGNQRLLS